MASSIRKSPGCLKRYEGAKKCCLQKLFIKKNVNALSLLNKTNNTESLPSVRSFWLKIDRYKVLIRNRDDLANKRPPGAPKTFSVNIEKDYVENGKNILRKKKRRTPWRFGWNNPFNFNIKTS